MWQKQTLERIQQALHGNNSVAEIVSLGSPIEDMDQWSDLDVGIIVHDSAFNDFFPATEWIKQFGDIYALHQSSGPGKGNSRVVFEDGSRVDFSIATDKSLLSAETPAPTAEAQAASLQSLGSDFKFEAFLAVSKLARNDLLISLHLVLGLESKCLVVAMMLRDRDLGTTHHRHGGPYNDVVEELKTSGATQSDLLGRVLETAHLFEKLSQQLDPAKTWDWQPLERYTRTVRGSLA